jgi:uncharacterized membrane protein
VPYLGYASIVLKVSPSLGILAGKNGRVVVTATSQDGKNYTATVDVEAEQYYGMEASILTDVITLRPGEEADLSLSLRNTGNGADTYSILLPRTELGIDAPTLSPSLEAFALQNFTITISVPADYKQSKERLQFGVESPNAGRVNIQLEVKIVRPDLSVVGASVVLEPAKPVDGQTVNMTATVKNSGNAPSGQVTVSLSEAGRTISTLILSGLAPGENATVLFGWNATAGSKRLAITAACGYLDPTPADASASISVDVAPRPVRRDPVVADGGISVAMLALAAVVLLVAVAVAALIFTRRKKAV